MIASASVLFGCLIWIPLAVWIMSLVHWTISGDVDAMTGVTGVVVAVGLGYTAMKPPIPIVSFATFVVTCAAVALFPFVRGVLHRRALRLIQVDAIERAYDVIGQEPNNALAKFKLARSLHAIGMVGQAVGIGQAVLAYIPERIFPDEHKMLNRWKASGIKPEAVRPVECIECHTLCPSDWTHCRTCGAPFLLDRARGRIMPKGQATKMIAAWASSVALLVGVPSASALPPVAAVVTILSLMAGAGIVLYLAFRPRIAERT